MTLPVTLRVNVKVPFPALVSGAGMVSVVKNNGIWTVKVDYTKLAAVPGVPNPTLYELAVYNISTGQYGTISLATAVASLSNATRTVTAAGDQSVAVSDVVILMNKTVGAPTNILLPNAASRLGVPVTVKDLKGDANVNNITFVPSAGETIDGFTATQAVNNGIALIDVSYGKKTLYPLPSGGWYL